MEAATNISLPNAWDYRNPTGFMGPTGQIAPTSSNSVRPSNSLTTAPPQPDWRLCLTQPSNLTLPTQGSVGEIFRSDLTGDGTTGDFLNSAATGIGHPGTFMRSVSPGNLNAYLTNFNNTVAGTLTPAGQALVKAGLFTQMSWSPGCGCSCSPGCRPFTMQGTAITKMSTRS